MTSSILVLGGAGDMGSAVVRFLAGEDRVEKITIGDVVGKRALGVIESLGEYKGKAEFLELDASNESRLIEVMGRYDAVVNAIGPFYYWAGRIAAAAVKAGARLVDICDDHEGARSVLALGGEAEKSGAIIITGLGWTPGITNVLARHASNRLDEVSSIDISWVGSAADSKGLAVIAHVLYATTGRVPMYLGGEERLVEAGSGTIRVEFPPPIGTVKVFYTGHPEPITIPRYIKVKDRVTLRGALIPEYQNSIVKLSVKLNLTKTHEGRMRLSRLIHRIESIFKLGGKPISGAVVQVAGKRRGEESEVTYGVSDRMYKLTSAPAAIGAVWLSKGRLKEPGVHPPEAVIDPVDFVKELEGKGIYILEKEKGTWRVMGGKVEAPS